MSLVALLDELEHIGIRLSRDGNDLMAEIQPAACLDPYRERRRPLLAARGPPHSAAPLFASRERYGPAWPRTLR